MDEFGKNEMMKTFILLTFLPHIWNVNELSVLMMLTSFEFPVVEKNANSSRIAYLLVIIGIQLKW